MYNPRDFTIIVQPTVVPPPEPSTYITVNSNRMDQHYLSQIAVNTYRYIIRCLDQTWYHINHTLNYVFPEESKEKKD